MHNNTIFESLYVCKLTSHQISLQQKYKFLCNFKKCNFTQLPYNIQGQKVYAWTPLSFLHVSKKKLKRGTICWKSFLCWLDAILWPGAISARIGRFLLKRLVLTDSGKMLFRCGARRMDCRLCETPHKNHSRYSAPDFCHPFDFYWEIKKNDFAGNLCFVKTEFFAAFRPGASRIMKVSTKNLS